jgi:FkbM family methyltransferase
LGVETSLGYFQGSSRDRAIMTGLMAHRTWAPEVQALFEEVFASGGTLVDIGANIGLTSIPIAKSRGIHCHAFEPDPENFRYLVSNIAANGAETVRPYNVALMAEDGVLSFERSLDNWGDHRVRMRDVPAGPFEEDRRSVIQVQGRRLDRVLDCDRLARPLVMKVDTQGAEVQVLRGATSLLPKVDVAILEYWPYGLRRMGDQASQLDEFVATFPYGAILDTGPGKSVYGGKPRFTATSALLADLRRLAPAEGAGIEWVDIVMSRTPALADVARGRASPSVSGG